MVAGVINGVSDVKSVAWAESQLAWVLSLLLGELPNSNEIPLYLGKIRITIPATV